MALPVVVFPDVELWATGTLRALITARTESYTDDVFVSNKMPKDADGKDYRKPRMVLVRRDGGPRLDVVREAARLGIQVWAETEQDCNNLARLVNALLWASPDGTPVCKVTITSGPSWVPDESKQPNTYSTAELIVRGTQL